MRISDWSSDVCSSDLRLMAMAHRKWGKLPWADLFQPAIHLAEGGFEVNEVLHGRLERMAALWKEFPKAQALYWREGGPAPVGEIGRASCRERVCQYV